MRELLIILEREFLQRVRSKSFIVSTLLTPVVFVVVALLPAVTGGGEPGPRRVAVLDETGRGIGAALVQALAPAAAGPRGVEMELRAPGDPGAETLRAEVELGSLDAFLRIPPDAVETGRAVMVSERALDPLTTRAVAEALTGALVAERLRALDVDPARLAAAMRPVELRHERIAGGEEAAADEAPFFFAFAVGFALYILMLTYGVQVLQSVQEEKTNRIAEILVSSVRSSRLMLGKVLGVGLAALLQVSIWGAAAALLASHGERLFGRLDLPTAGLASLLDPLDLRTGLLIGAFALLGFFLYASLFAGAGAAAGSTEDAQRFTFPIVLPLVVPMLFGERIVSDPAGTTAVVLSWVPLTMPLAMPMRIGLEGAGAGAIAGALAVLLLSVALAAVVAGRIYRIGILSTGKRPSLRELARWLRTP